MPASRGFLAKAGIGEESTWGTAVAATERILMKTANARETEQPLADTVITGSAAKEDESPGPITAPIDLATRMYYPDATVVNPFLLLKHGMGEQVGTLYRNVINEAWVALRVSGSDNVELAQAVTVAGSGTKIVQSVRLLLRKRGTLPSGNLAVEIQGDSAGAPDGTPIANGTSTNVAVTGVTLDDFGIWITFTFAVAPTVTGGTAYHVVLTGTYTADAANNIEMGVETVASGGGFEIFDASWADSATQNMNLRWYTSSFTDTFLPINDLEGLGLTYAEDKGGPGVFEFAGAKVASWELSGTPTEGLTFTATMASKERSGSPTNTAAGLAALQVIRTKIPFTDLVAWIGDQADVLAVADAVNITSFRLSVNHDMDSVNTNGGRTIIEPLNSQRTVALELVMPRFATAQFHTWQKARTPLQVRLHFNGTTQFLTTNLAHVVLEPEVDAGIQGPGPLQITVRGNAKRNISNRVMRLHDDMEMTLTNV